MDDFPQILRYCAGIHERIIELNQVSKTWNLCSDEHYVVYRIANHASHRFPRSVTRIPALCVSEKGADFIEAGPILDIMLLNSRQLKKGVASAHNRRPFALRSTGITSTPQHRCFLPLT